MKASITTVFLLMICIGNIALADNYTIDKRRYVSDAERTIEPYKFVTRLTNGRGDCVGNFTSSGRLVTAAVCDNDAWWGFKGTGDMSPSRHTASDGSKYKQTHEQRDNIMVYQLKDDYYGVRPEGNNNILGSPRFGTPMTFGGQVKIISFSEMAIMSDEEINQFRRDYIRYLWDVQGIHGNYKLLEELADSNIHAKNRMMQDFIIELQFDKNPEKYGTKKDLFRDYNKMKESTCFVSGIDLTADVIQLTHCQAGVLNYGDGVYANTDWVPRMTNKEYIEYLEKQHSQWNTELAKLQEFLSTLDTMDKQILQEYLEKTNNSTKEDLLEDVNSDIAECQTVLDAINQEIQSASSGTPDSQWMLIGIVTDANQSFRADDFKGNVSVTSVRNIGPWAAMIDWGNRHNRYNHYVDSVLSVQQTRGGWNGYSYWNNK